MKNLIKIYNEMTNDSRIFYESILRKHTINEIENKKFYEHLIKINDDKKLKINLFEEYNIVSKNGFLIFESHDDAKLNKKLINLIYQTNNFEQIKLSDIFSCLSNKFKHDNDLNIDQNFPIYIFKFDFLNPTPILHIFKSFKIPYSSSNESINDQLIIEKNKFKKYVGNSNGLYFNGGNCFLLFLNINKENHFSENTINHEIYHLIQDVFNLHINVKDLFDINENSLKHLQLDKKDLEYLYQKDEFETHIKVNLINQLNEIYWKFYRNISRNLFIEKFLYQCDCGINVLFENEFSSKIMKKEIKNSDSTSIRLFLSTFLIKDDTWNQLAVKWLRESFN